MAPLVSVRSFIAVRYDVCQRPLRASHSEAAGAAGAAHDAAQICAKDRCVPHTVKQQVLQELCATPLHQVGCWGWGCMLLWVSLCCLLLQTSSAVG
jgi:hypothetical protein